MVGTHSAFVVQHSPDGKVIHFTAKGLNTALVHAMGTELDQLVHESARRRLHLDFTQVEYLSGAALGKIAAMNSKVKNAGGEFVVKNIDDFPYELFQVTRLDTVMSVWPKHSRTAVLASA